MRFNIIAPIIMLCCIASTVQAHCLTGVENEALKDLNPQQIDQLCREGLLIVGELKDASADNLVQSMLIFKQPREKVFRLLCATERQIEYIPRLIEAKVIRRDDDSDTIEFYVGASVFKFRYQVDHEYEPDDWMLKWELNPDFDNDVRRVEGHYKLYAMPDGRTFARYATVFSVSGAIPQSIQNALAKGDLPEALSSLKKWVDSGGTWRRPKQ